MPGWLDRLLRRKRAEPSPKSAAAPAPVTAPAPDTAPPPAAPLHLEPAGDQFGYLAHLQLAPAPQLEPDDPADPAAPGRLEQRLEAEAAEQLLAGRLLDHFRAHRPGPGSLPQLALRILNLVADPDADPGELAQLVSRDPAIAAGVLRVANSAAYPQGSPAQTVRDAINRIGLRELARIAGTLSAGALFNPKARAEFAAYGAFFQEQFHHATATSMAASSLAMSVPHARSDRAFLAGLLHDVGGPIALRSLAALAHDDPALRALGPDRVRRLIDRVHVEIGSEVHQKWGLPDFATVVCVRHHDTVVPAGPDFADVHTVRLSSALHLARSLPPDAARLAEIVQSAQALGLSRFQLRSFEAEVRVFTQRAAVFTKPALLASAPPQRAARGSR